MPLLTDKQIEARNCLAVGSHLTDPKYLFPQAVALERFKERCRLCWHLRDYWPDWAKVYAAKWKAEKEAT
jgi:hypothetical protein